MNLAPFQQRVVDEHRELSERLAKLTAFFDTEIYAGLDGAEQTRLNAQAMFMAGYQAMLALRIAAFKP